MIRALSATALLCLLCGCDVASVREAPDTIARNECQSSADCGGGACVSQQCRSPSGAFQSVLFEVTPPADGSVIAGVQFLVPKTDLGQGEDDISLQLGSISEVVGKVTAEGRDCSPKFLGALGIVAMANDSSVPARVSLTPRSSALGLYSPRAVVQSDLIENSYWGFSVNVAPGTYDLYVEPGPQGDESCPVPPQLLRGQDLMLGTTMLKIALPEPLQFELHVSWPLGDGALDGWMVDMLDPKSGHVISNRVALALAADGKTDYVSKISYAPVVTLSKEGIQQQASAEPQDPWIRLSPPVGLPDSVALPTVLLARSALGLFTANRGTLSDFTSLPSAVLVHGQVTSGNTPNPAAATVTLVAQKITGIDPGILASFTRTVEVGDDGLFDVYLPPGTYRVSTVPQAPLDPSPNDEAPLAADTRDWIVPSEPEQAGKVIELGRALAVSGRVVGASDLPVATAHVQALASPASVQGDVLQESFTGAAFVPRASVGGVDSGGNFSLKADPGTFDISVRPNANTGFAWLVMPRVPVTFAKSGAGLGTLSMPLPVPYHGTVTQGGDGPAIPGALVRAYIYLKGSEYTADPTKADSVLQIAETRADKTGAFDLAIPAGLNRAPE